MSALSVIQLEEVKRIGQFVFQRDAKFAIVSTSETTMYNMV